jgi:hypothetical protein
MNKNKIGSYDDLLEEKKRLEQLLTVNKEQISTNWIEMKKEFEPVNNIFSFFGKLTRRDKSNPLLNIGLDVAGDLVLRRIILARFGWATRIVVPFLLKNYSSNVLVGKGKSLIHTVKHWLKGHKNGQQETAAEDSAERFSN